jgi:fructose-bisphosphate aldolase, class I
MRINFEAVSTKAKDDQVLSELRAIRDGAGFGSIIGRNSFQRPGAEARKLLDGIAKILAS